MIPYIINHIFPTKRWARAPKPPSPWIRLWLSVKDYLIIKLWNIIIKAYYIFSKQFYRLNSMFYERQFRTSPKYILEFEITNWRIRYNGLYIRGNELNLWLRIIQFVVMFFNPLSQITKQQFSQVSHIILSIVLETDIFTFLPVISHIYKLFLKA